MKLCDARICLDCDEIFVPETVTFLDQRVKMDHCPSCGSQQHYLLCRWIPTIESVEHITKRLAKHAGLNRHSRGGGNPVPKAFGMDHPIKSDDDKEKEGPEGFIHWNPERIQT